MWEVGSYRPFKCSALGTVPQDDTKFDGLSIDRVLPDVALTLRPASYYGASKKLGVFFGRPMAVLYAEETLALDPHKRLERAANGWTYPIYVCECSRWMTDEEVLEVNRKQLTHWAIVTLNDTMHVLAPGRIGLQWQEGETDGFWSDGTPLN